MRVFLGWDIVMAARVCVGHSCSCMIVCLGGGEHLSLWIFVNILSCLVILDQDLFSTMGEAARTSPSQRNPEAVLALLLAGEIGGCQKCCWNVAATKLEKFQVLSHTVPSCVERSSLQPRACANQPSFGPPPSQKVFGSGITDVGLTKR